jgi:hypothetical protein
VDTIKSAVKELELYGYLKRSEKQEHNEDGTFADYVWTTADPFQNPDTVKPASGKQDTKNTITKEQQPIKNKQENTDTGFDKFWEIYPKKVAKADALKAWNKAIKTKTADELLKVTKAYAESKLPDTTYIPYPASWLNKGLYESVEVAEAKPLPKLFIGRVK